MRRAEVASWKDVPDGDADMVEWWKRMQDLYATDGSDPDYRWHESLNELGAERIRQLGKEYKADFVITERIAPPLGLDLAYQNKHYAIYHLPD